MENHRDDFAVIAVAPAGRPWRRSGHVPEDELTLLLVEDLPTQYLTG
jgi:hypothetical protein